MVRDAMAPMATPHPGFGVSVCAGASLLSNVWDVLQGAREEECAGRARCTVANRGHPHPPHGNIHTPPRPYSPRLVKSSSTAVGVYGSSTRMTPPDHTSTPQPEYQAFSTSATFHPLFETGGCCPDTVLVTQNYAVFNVHSKVLLANSTNKLGGLLGEDVPVVIIPETDDVVDIVLRIMYGMSCLHDPPSMDTTEQALAALRKYGAPLAQLAALSSPLYWLVLSYAPHAPIETYALAGHYGLEHIAVEISPRLLAYDLSNVSEELIVKMGPVYFRRLFHLQRSRLAALRRIVLRTPALHAPTETCDAERQQQQVIRAWAFASADIVWNALPNTSTHALCAAFTQAGSTIDCLDCQVMVQTRIQELISEWSALKRTI
ncbi:hypothetical protein BD413DRAFT_94443 [Trametes elegans]|nr:hypothetical protein BD413DRAFT_94443 [Trametes elegans]